MNFPRLPRIPRSVERVANVKCWLVCQNATSHNLHCTSHSPETAVPLSNNITVSMFRRIHCMRLSSYRAEILNAEWVYP